MVKHNPEYSAVTFGATGMLMVVLFWSTTGIAAPITFNTALPVAQGEFLIREQLVMNQSGDDPGNANRDRTASATVPAPGYGINHKRTVFGILP